MKGSSQVEVGESFQGEGTPQQELPEEWGMKSAGLVLGQPGEWGERGGETGWGQPLLRAGLGTSRGQPLSWISLNSGHFNRRLHGEQTREGKCRNGETREGQLAQWERVAEKLGSQD